MTKRLFLIGLYELLLLFLSVHFDARDDYWNFWLTFKKKKSGKKEKYPHFYMPNASRNIQAFNKLDISTSTYQSRFSFDKAGSFFFFFSPAVRFEKVTKFRKISIVVD